MLVARPCRALLSLHPLTHQPPPVTRFARATGDVAALSTVDIKLLALVHTLEVAAHGADHLLTHPNQVGQLANWLNQFQ